MSTSIAGTRRSRFGLRASTWQGKQGFRAHEIKGVVEMVRANSKSFLEAWHGCFG